MAGLCAWQSCDISTADDSEPWNGRGSLFLRMTGFVAAVDPVSSFDASSKSHKAPRTPRHVLPSPPRFSLSSEMSSGSFHLNFNQIVKATHYFAESHKIGEGGFGTVYKAVLPDGRIVAVKRAKKVIFPHILSCLISISLLFTSCVDS